MFRISTKTILILSAGAIALSACTLSPNRRDDRTGSKDGAYSSKRPTDASMRRTATGADNLAWKDHAFPTGSRSTSAVMLRKGTPAEVRLNEEFEYVLEITNLTSGNLEDVVVSDRLPGKFSLKSATPKAANNSKGVAEWIFPKLSAGQTKVIKVRGIATGQGDLKGCSTVSYDSRICSTISVVQPAIELTKVMPKEALICEKIPVRYIVKNTGSGTARNVVVKEQLSANLQTANRRPVQFTIPSLESGKSREFTVDVQAGKVGTYNGRATATAGKLNANSKVTTTIVRQPMLKVTAKGPQKTYLGRDVTYTFNVANVGDATAAKSVLESGLPSGSRFVSATQGGRMSRGKIVWNLNSMSPKATRNVSVTIRSITAGTLRMDAAASATCANVARASVKSEMVGIPAILMEVIDVHDPIAVGEDETYEIRVTNQGTAAGTNIKIECMLEDSMQFVRAGGATRGSHAAGKVTLAPLASLAPKAKASWRVIVKATKAADARFTVSMTSDQTKRPVAETEASNFYK